jgi:hypothetical protein
MSAPTQFHTDTNLGFLHKAGDKRIIDTFVHIHALDAAAALAAVEECSIRELDGRVLNIGIGPHVGGILAAQLQANAF